MKAVGRFLLMLTLMVVLYACHKDEPITPVVSESTVSANATYVAASGSLSVVLSVSKTAGLSNASFGLCLGKSPKPTIATAIENKETPKMDFSKSPYSNSFQFNIDKSSDYYICTYSNLNGVVTYYDDIKIQTIAVTDVEGNNYHSVKLDKFEVMVEPLKTTLYADKTAIPNITGDAACNALTTGAYVCYGNDPANKATFGLLYNWYAVNSTHRLAPDGWHVMTYDEWVAIINAQGGSNSAGGNLKQAGTSIWLAPNTGATNSSGLTVLPGGGRVSTGFESLNKEAMFWTATPFGSGADAIGFTYKLAAVDYNGVYLFTDDFSVKCVKNY